MKLSLILFIGALTTAQAQLAITMSPVKVIGQKAVVPLAMKNNFAAKVESARAAVFLLDDQGKVVGQATRWVIGGSQDKPGLAPGATNAFYFVIASPKPILTTNLTTKISVTRLVMEGGQVVDPSKAVQMVEPTGTLPPPRQH